jgi:hypothetical protein
MMPMEHKYTKWEPVEGIENEIWVEALHDDYEGLRILLKGSSESSGVLSISFPQYYGYRNVDESYRDKLWQTGDFEERDWSLFKTTASEFIEWLFEQSGGVYSKEEMVHYVVKTGADVIEVVANLTPPKVEWLTSTASAESSGGTIAKRGKRGTYFNK